MDFRTKPTFQEHYELVENHLLQNFNKEEIAVFHEIPTLDIHLDVYHIKPRESEFEILFTSGMSSIAMNVDGIPEDADSYRFAELMTLIPKGLDFGRVYPSNTKFDWIISMIKQTAKFPHFYDTWLGIGHTIQATEDLQPYSENTNICGCMLLPTMTFNEDFQKIQSPKGQINIFSIFPMYKEEIEFKIENGFNSFIQFLINNNASEVLDFSRPNYCN